MYGWLNGGYVPHRRDVREPNGETAIYGRFGWNLTTNTRKLQTVTSNKRFGIIYFLPRNLIPHTSGTITIVRYQRLFKALPGTRCIRSH